MVHDSGADSPRAGGYLGTAGTMCYLIQGPKVAWSRARRNRVGIPWTSHRASEWGTPVIRAHSTRGWSTLCCPCRVIPGLLHPATFGFWVCARRGGEWLFHGPGLEYRRLLSLEHIQHERRHFPSHSPVLSRLSGLSV